MKCKSCGAEVERGRVCKYCGTIAWERFSDDFHVEQNATLVLEVSPDMNVTYDHIIDVDPYMDERGRLVRTSPSKLLCKISGVKAWYVSDVIAESR